MTNEDRENRKSKKDRGEKKVYEALWLASK